ncbi:uncharacterized protein LOC113776822 [Coffea eugenioides]|uniref:uncharacterized protein LOC113776717 n=1 Tax=Coffea eugenioides TaxID=49369 RepID=UPI000F606678|nr:uncharacterized protein LOC113776717 [Coffea eugenioides]XP_027177681.1 uncharacterized protein LOC113776822 [Coffea eugenioides]
MRRLKEATPESLVPLTDFEDQVVWEGCRSGVFNTKSVMKALYTTRGEVSWSKLVWGKGYVPRYAFIVWLLCKKKLPTMDRLRKCGVSLISNMCVFCKRAEESMEHLYFNCCMTRPVWAKVQHMCLTFRGSCSWDQNLAWLAAHLRSNSFADQLRRLCFAATV